MRAISESDKRQAVDLMRSAVLAHAALEAAAVGLSKIFGIQHDEGWDVINTHASIQEVLDRFGTEVYRDSPAKPGP